jgi:sterol desaturase/sphingolipid hydroxylase (fatty acid hydroxylase superfamily)
MTTRLAYPGLLVLFGVLVALVAGHGPVGFMLAATAIWMVLVPLERAFPLVEDERVEGDPELGHDIGHTLLSSGIAQASDAAMLAAGALVAARLGRAWDVHVWPVGWPFAVQAVVFVVLADGLEYWRHRLEHRTPWLWRFHALHHDVERLHVIKSARNTFADLVLRSVVVYGPLATLGAPAEVMGWHPLVLLALGPISHANLALPIPPAVHRLLVTPPGHRIHHARDRACSDANFAVVTPLWDLLFGTFRDPGASPPLRVGIDERLPSSFVRQALSPFWWPRPAGEGAAAAVPS